MIPPPIRALLFVLASASGAAAADDTPVLESPTPISLKAALISRFKYQPVLKEASEPPPKIPMIFKEVAAAPPTVMTPYVVKELSEQPHFKGVTAAIEQ